MILCDDDIEKRIDERSLVLKPFDRKLIGPNSIDLRLGNEFRIFKHIAKTHIDPLNDSEDYTELKVINNGEFFILHPNEFILATTHEWIEMPNDLAANLDGRSSLGRLGIIIQTAAMVDAGFKGKLTLEVANIGKMPVKIYPRMKICKLTLHKLSKPCKNPYSGKYQGQTTATPSRISKDKEDD